MAPTIGAVLLLALSLSGMGEPRDVSLAYRRYYQVSAVVNPLAAQQAMCIVHKAIYACIAWNWHRGEVHHLRDLPSR
jgi:hypothetical protein